MFSHNEDNKIMDTLDNDPYSSFSYLGGINSKISSSKFLACPYE